MKVAVMQPYFLPYLGYWQLFAAVDRFVLLDDVNYIVRGWVNRNRIWVGGKEQWMTIPLSNASQNRLISETLIVEGNEWKQKLMRTVQGAYAKAPCFAEGRDWLAEILDTEERNLASFLARSIRIIATRLGLGTSVERSSSLPGETGLRAEARIIELCKMVGAGDYYNLPGGRDLYAASSFSREGLDLRFLRSDWDSIGLESASGELTFSLLDLRMHNSTEALRKAMEKCSFET